MFCKEFCWRCIFCLSTQCLNGIFFKCIFLLIFLRNNNFFVLTNHSRWPTRINFKWYSHLFVVFYLFSSAFFLCEIFQSLFIFLPGNVKLKWTRLHFHAILLYGDHVTGLWWSYFWIFCPLFLLYLFGNFSKKFSVLKISTTCSFSIFYGS